MTGDKKVDKKLAKQIAKELKKQKAEQQAKGCGLFLILCIVIGTFLYFNTDSDQESLTKNAPEFLKEKIADIRSDRYKPARKLAVSNYLKANNIDGSVESNLYICFSQKINVGVPQHTVDAILRSCGLEYKVNGKFLKTYYNLDNIEGQFNAWRASHKKLDAFIDSKLEVNQEYSHENTRYRIVLAGENAPYIALSTWFSTATPSGNNSQSHKISARANIITGEILEITEHLNIN